MTRINAALFIIGMLGLAGCTSKDQSIAEAKIKTLNMNCVDNIDCPVKWDRALRWVTENSRYKIRVANDSLITTEGPMDQDTDSAFTITKVSHGDGTSDILFRSACDNLIGCIPTHEVLLASFGSYIGAASTTVTSEQAGPRKFGIQFNLLPATLLHGMQIQADQGFQVFTVTPGSPAASAGIQPGDIILTFNGQPVANVAALQNTVASEPAGASIPVGIWRAGQQMTVTAKF